MVIKASDGTIGDNRLVDNHGEAIMVAPTYWWLEAGSSSNLTIEDNVISGCLDAAIAVYSNGGDRSVSPAGAFNNVRIVGNSVRASVNPGIAVTSAKELTLDGNDVTSPLPFDAIEPWRRNKFGRADDRARAVYLRNVEQ